MVKNEELYSGIIAIIQSKYFTPILTIVIKRGSSNITELWLLKSYDFVPDLGFQKIIYIYSECVLGTVLQYTDGRCKIRCSLPWT